MYLQKEALAIAQRHGAVRFRPYALAGIGAKVRVDEVHRREPEADGPGQVLHYRPQGPMGREQLHLARTVHQKVAVLCGSDGMTRPDRAGASVVAEEHNLPFFNSAIFASSQSRFSAR